MPKRVLAWTQRLSNGSLRLPGTVTLEGAPFAAGAAAFVAVVVLVVVVVVVAVGNAVVVAVVNAFVVAVGGGGSGTQGGDKTNCRPQTQDQGR